MRCTVLFQHQEDYSPTFMSRCRIFLLCMYSTAMQICFVITTHAFSVRTKSSLMTRSNSSPPSTLKKRRKKSVHTEKKKKKSVHTEKKENKLVHTEKKKKTVHTEKKSPNRSSIFFCLHWNKKFGLRYFSTMFSHSWNSIYTLQRGAYQDKLKTLDRTLRRIVFKMRERTE